MRVGLLRNSRSNRCWASCSTLRFFEMPKMQFRPFHCPNQTRVSTGTRPPSR